MEKDVNLLAIFLYFFDESSYNFVIFLYAFFVRIYDLFSSIFLAFLPQPLQKPPEGFTPSEGSFMQSLS